MGKDRAAEGTSERLGAKPRAVKTLAGLAVDDYGESDHRPALVLLHGLTFDRAM